MTDDGDERVLTVVVCGAGPATEVGRLVELAHDRGWVVRIVATPSAVALLDVPALETLTDNPVRSAHRPPGADRRGSRPTVRALIVAPASFNTICKLAGGISDTYALDVLAEAVGRGIHVVVLPFVNSALSSRRPFVEAVESLRSEGVRVLFGPGQWEPHEPGNGVERIAIFPWSAALDAVDAVIGRVDEGNSLDD